METGESVVRRCFCCPGGSCGSTRIGGRWSVAVDVLSERRELLRASSRGDGGCVGHRLLHLAHLSTDRPLLLSWRRLPSSLSLAGVSEGFGDRGCVPFHGLCSSAEGFDGREREEGVVVAHWTA